MRVAGNKRNSHAREGGHRERDTGQMNEAFRLAREALAIGVAYGSERIIQHARKFWHTHTGPMTTGVREFEQQLRSTIP